MQAMVLALGQADAGHDVLIAMNARPSEPLHPTILPWIQRGLRVETFRMNRKREAFRYRKFLKAARPDVIHCHRNEALQFTYFATFGLRPKPVLVTQRGTTRGMQTRLIGRIHRSPRVRRIIAVAQAVKASLMEAGVKAEKIRVIYGSCDLSRFDPDRVDPTGIRAELGLEAGQPLVVQVGELIAKKAPTDFIRAAARVAERRPDAMFALVGPGKLLHTCRALVDELGLGDQFRVFGFRPDIPEILAAADVVVNCSVRDEGLTGALREALAMARPVVATDVSGNSELVRDGETGSMVPAGVPEQIAAAVLGLLDQPDRARRLADAGRALVLKLMSPARRLEATLSVYHEAIAERTGRSQGHRLVRVENTPSE